MSERQPWQTLSISEEGAGARLDTWLAATVEGLSRQGAKALLSTGDVLLNGRTAPKATIVRAGDRVDILSAPTPRLWHPRVDDTIPLSVIYQDNAIIAVEKPNGVPSVPLREQEGGTLAGMVAARFPECRTVQKNNGDGGLVQRLDRETSGVVLVARSQEIHNHLVKEQHAGRIEKTYLALVHTPSGPPPRIIETALKGAGPKGRKMAPDDTGLAAETTVEPLRAYNDWSLVRATIHRGVRHQIRAHLAGAGSPIAGDQLYGRPEESSCFPRLFLHAHEIHLNQPLTGAPLVISSPLPGALMSILENMDQ